MGATRQLSPRGWVKGYRDGGEMGDKTQFFLLLYH